MAYAEWGEDGRAPARSRWGLCNAIDLETLRRRVFGIRVRHLVRLVASEKLSMRRIRSCSLGVFCESRIGFSILDFFHSLARFQIFFNHGSWGSPTSPHLRRRKGRRPPGPCANPALSKIHRKCTFLTAIA